VKENTPVSGILSENLLRVLSGVYDIFIELSPGIIMTASCEAIK
jgi:hypothetical protein